MFGWLNYFTNRNKEEQSRVIRTREIKVAACVFPEPEMSLIEAITQGNNIIVTAHMDFLDSIGAEKKFTRLLNSKDEYGANALSIAAKKRLYSPSIDTKNRTIDRLLAALRPEWQYQLIAAQDIAGCTALHSAARTEGGANIMQNLLAKLGHEQVKAQCLAVQNENGYTALHTAADCRNYHTVKLLLKHGADTTIECHHGNENGLYQAADLAALHGSSAIVAIINKKAEERTAIRAAQSDEGYRGLQKAASDGYMQTGDVVLFQSRADTKCLGGKAALSHPNTIVRRVERSQSEVHPAAGMEDRDGAYSVKVNFSEKSISESGRYY